jgi:lysophospholipase L1-like esterase
MSSRKLLILLTIFFFLLPFVYLIVKSFQGRVLSAHTKNYSIILVGDSMTAALGTNTPELKDALAKYYPNTNFDISNYSIGSTNFLTVDDRLEHESTIEGQLYPPILSRDFDLIIIESFSHNPLSQFPLAQGLALRTKKIDDLLNEIRQQKPNSKIVFMATIAPNRDRYAENTINLMPEQRHAWADERTAYLLNYIEYAKNHNIPLIDVYDKSLKDGTGNIDYINTKDFIHPNPSGVILISQTIADFIYQNKLVK